MSVPRLGRMPIGWIDKRLSQYLSHHTSRHNCIATLIYLCYIFSMCENSDCILNTYVCDGYTDCSDNNADEIYCNEAEYQLINNYLICNPFYISDFSRGESCFPIDVLTNKLLLNLRTQFTQYNTEHNAKIKYKTTCTSSDSDIYRLSKVCMFERDIYGNPAHCRNTEHLKFCQDHSCPGTLFSTLPFSK